MYFILFLFLFILFLNPQMPHTIGENTRIALFFDTRGEADRKPQSELQF